MSDSTPPEQDFATTVSALETLVERLESGELSLEEALGAFEQGVKLTRDAQARLDRAELKVRALTEDADGQLRVAPFDQPPSASGDAPDDDQEQTPPW
ncbi:exodeoxyribonuclease VII small subunit [Vreelandella malpeensis]|uniref:Exodeoxyribonuclease 7 small subunit n=1 Tax=Vreelandella malpeensis TaxID=1172368 RepID=A0ABS8DTB9_9GAMM|nr:exodeoxyribonuclease VII small subunit [Halomonas malpeensis]MCB8889290.1 exodeoxyribonuclease VII small subunit [Halomonas malpeensis]